MDDQERSRVDVKRLYALARPEWKRLSWATLALLISSGLNLAYPQGVRYVVDGILGGDEQGVSLNTAATLLFVAFAVQGLFSGLRAWLFTVAGERIVANLRTQLFSAIIHQDVAFFDLEKTGELTNRLSSDTTVLQNTVTVNVSMGLRFALGAVGGLAMLFWMSPSLTLVSMAVVPVVAIGSAIYGRIIRRLSRRVQDALAASTEVAEETIAGVRTVRSFAREQQEVDRYGGAVEESFKLAAKRAFANGSFAGIASFAGYAAIALVVLYGGRMVMANEMTVGELTAFLIYTGLVAVSLGTLASLYGDFNRAIGASRRVFDLLDKTETFELAGGAKLDHVDGHVKFEGVHFAYPSRPEADVLTGFEFEMKPGQVIALVGPSGSGKSTVAALIARFYDPQRGRILIDEQELTRLDPRALRDHIGAVMQEPILFATSVADNIRYGKPSATLDEVKRAAKAANASGFIESFQDGYETLVGERGVRLSGGQKQRVAIARAVLKDPAVLILDEATSALDSESEQLVQEALDRLMQGRTTLIIAHRLSTVIDADQVVVLDEGRVVEAGTHPELMTQRGLYRRLVERQFNAA